MINKRWHLKKILMAVILILLSTIIIINAQETQDPLALQETQIAEAQDSMDLQSDNIEITNTEAINTEIEAMSDIIQEQANSCENVKCDDSTLICPDQFLALCENSCDLETGACGSCIPNCEGHEQIIKQNKTENEANKVLENETEITSEVVEINTSVSELLELNKTEIANQTENQNNRAIENKTSEKILEEIEIANETGEKNISVSGTGEAIRDIFSNPDLDVQFYYLKKMTRGEVAEIEAIITNNGIKLKNVAATWILPQNFEIISGNQSENCGNLNKMESCILVIKIKSSLSTSLGKNQIKITASYET